MTEKQGGPAFGQRVTWTAFLVRKTENGRRFWQRVPLKNACSGLYNGPRTLKNGKLEWVENGRFFSEGYFYFSADEQIPAYLVVENANVNQVRVLPEDCQWQPVISKERLSEIDDILWSETGNESHHHSRMKKVVGALRDLWNERGS